MFSIQEREISPEAEEVDEKERNDEIEFNVFLIRVHVCICHSATVDTGVRSVLRVCFLFHFFSFLHSRLFFPHDRRFAATNNGEKANKNALLKDVFY